jgi:hypothetical protein
MWALWRIGLLQAETEEPRFKISPKLFFELLIRGNAIFFALPSIKFFLLGIFFYKFTIYFEILPLVVFFLRFSYLWKQKEAKLIAFLAVLSLLTDLYSMLSLQGKPSINISLNIYCLIETSLLIVFFNLFLSKHIGRYTFIFIWFLFLILWLLFNFKTKFVLFDSKSLAIEVALVIGASFLFFYYQLRNPKILYIYKTHRFWFATAFLVNLTGILFFFLYLPSLNKEEREIYNNLNLFFLILRTIFLSIGMLITEEKDETFTSNNLLA